MAIIARNWKFLAGVGFTIGAEVSYVLFRVSTPMVKGKSMDPLFIQTKRIFVDRFFYRSWYPIKRNDIIMFNNPQDANMSVCKRIKYLPGEKIQVLDTKTRKVKKELTIPENHVWVEGDNNPLSLDSRVWGPIPIDAIDGKVLFSMFPFRRLYHNDYMFQYRMPYAASAHANEHGITIKKE